MNIFEDLIEELKEENLIEQTVIETSKAEADAKKPDNKAVKTETAAAPQTIQNLEDETVKEPSTETAAENFSSPTDADSTPEEPFDKADFYRKRAMEEVDFLQTVEHVFAGVEREQLKIVPNPYDDLKVKKVLHSFLQISPDAEAELANAQFQLLQETESWHSSLALRDMQILTAHLRRYCETSRPPLSSPALIALARFYRNSPYSEQVRSKFDLVVTRLFTKEAGSSRREMLFTRDELAAHIKDLYAEWSSVPLYSIEEDDAQITQTAGHFEEFIKEADAVENFDQLINSNFFNRLRLFKESTNEVFYAPLVAATGIEINIRVGNRYIELLNREKEKGSVAALEDKYGLAHDQTVSEATGKTTSLIELLRQKKPEPAPVEVKPAAEPVKAKAAKPETAPEKTKSGFSKWIIAALVLTIIIFGVYLITSSNSVEPKEVSIVPKMNLENSMLKEYLQEARVQDGTLNAIVLPAWAKLSEDKKKEILKQTLALGGEKGYKKVELKNKEGKSVGSAEGESILVLE